jgi:propanol-preferring alcohol dehydrogenase
MRAAPLLCAGIIGFRSLRVAGVQPRERVGLFGFGASAHLAIAVLNAWECPVYVSTCGASHPQLASSLGAAWVATEREKPPVPLDRAITFAPSGDVVVAALASLHKGGVSPSMLFTWIACPSSTTTGCCGANGRSGASRI